MLTKCLPSITTLMGNTVLPYEFPCTLLSLFGLNLAQSITKICRGKSLLHEVTPEMLKVDKTLQFSLFTELSTEVERELLSTTTTENTLRAVEESLLSTSVMFWKPPWLLYTSIAMVPPGELSSIVVVRSSLIHFHPRLLLLLQQTWTPALTGSACLWWWAGACPCPA